jgi:hypothetical protein
MILEEKLKQLQEKIKQNPLTSLTILIAVLLLLLIVIPYLQVGYRGINNATQEATLENQYRATFAQILGGVAIGIGLYYTWRRITIAENNLKVSQEGQITERFTRAVDQLGAIDQSGNPAIEIRLGGIYALERIANESEKDYWPIMEILTAYVRKNSSIEIGDNNKVTHISMDIQANESTKSGTQEIAKISLDTQAILTVIGRRKYSFGAGESIRLNLSGTYLRKSILKETNLERANFGYAYLENAYLGWSHLKQAVFLRANLENAYLGHSYLENAVFIETNLENTDLSWANLKDALLMKAHIKRTIFRGANLEHAYFDEANLEGAYFIGADLTGAKNLTIDQLSKVKTLYNAKLDEELLIPLREKCPALFDEPKDEP